MEQQAPPTLDAPTPDDVLREVNGFLDETGMAHTRFGREAIGEGSFVKLLREGRVPSLTTVNKVLDFIRSHRAEQADADHAVADTIGEPVPSPGKSSAITEARA